MDVALQVAGIAVSLGVVWGCICRVNLMRYGQHKAGWLLMYTAAAPGAGGMAIDLATARDVDWYSCWLIAAFALHLILTRRLWLQGPPAETEAS